MFGYDGYWYCCCGKGPSLGGNRTTGLPPSIITLLLRDMTDPAGEIIPSRPISRAIDDLLLIATLGEY